MERVYPIEVRRLYLSKGHDFKGRFGKSRLHNGVEEVTSIDCVAGKGLPGDRYFDYREDYKGQATLLDEATVEEVAKALGRQSLDPSAFRRNILTRGFDLNALIGRRFRLGSVLLAGSEECAPCFWMDETVGEGALAAMKGRGGLRCRILESGTIELGRQLLELVEG